jgi:hypothetical protein
MKSVKLFVAAMLVAASFAAHAQDKAKPAAATKMAGPNTTQLKEHKCTHSCTAASHSYVHGEKGHTCTAECKKPTVTKKA